MLKWCQEREFPADMTPHDNFRFIKFTESKSMKKIQPDTKKKSSILSTEIKSRQIEIEFPEHPSKGSKDLRQMEPDDQKTAETTEQSPDPKVDEQRSENNVPDNAPLTIHISVRGDEEDSRQMDPDDTKDSEKTAETTEHSPDPKVDEQCSENNVPGNAPLTIDTSVRGNEEERSGNMHCSYY